MGYDIKAIRKKYFPGAGGQAEFAKKIGISRQQLSAWERGERKPGIKSMGKIAAALNISLAQLRGDDIPIVQKRAEMDTTIVDALSDHITTLKAANTKLEDAVARLESENRNLLVENKQLLNENATLQNESASLRVEMERLRALSSERDIRQAGSA